MLKGEEHGNWDTYLDHIGLFFFFCACAGVSIIVWIFNWICWLNHCCCCDFLHNPVNKRITWWMGFTFLLGILACCISAFVTVNRFGFAFEGSWCAVDRIYYDSINGQLKQTEPRWEGFDNLTKVFANFTAFLNSVRDTAIVVKPINNNDDKYQLIKIKYALLQLKKLEENEVSEINNKITSINEMLNRNNFNTMKEKFLDEFHYYAKTLRACLKVLAMIYYCLLLIAVTFSGVSMMFFCLFKKARVFINFYACIMECH